MHYIKRWFRSANFPTTYLFVGICLVVFVLQNIGIVDYQKYGLVPRLVKEGEVYRIFTSAFLHGSLTHIAGNLLSLINMGSVCEYRWSKKNYLIAILASIVGAGLSVTLLSNPSTVTIGLSGAVFGVFGYFSAMLYKEDGVLSYNEKTIIARILIPNILISLMPGVSWQGHFGGFIAGALVALFLP